MCVLNAHVLIPVCRIRSTKNGKPKFTEKKITIENKEDETENRHKPDYI